jgi:hypothetical protein
MHSPFEAECRSQFLLRHDIALIAYLLRKKVKYALSVRPSPRRALAWLISAHRVLRWKAFKILTPRAVTLPV